MLKKAEKIEVTSALAQELKEADGFVICSFQGLTVKASNKMRRELFAINAKARVFKNRLLKHALAANNFEGFDDVLTQSTMVVIGREDALATLRVLGKFAAENELLGFKAGYMTGKTYAKDDVIELSKLPGRIELIAMVLGGMTSVLAKFNGTIEALADKKEKSA
ncbi:MAG: 50S ribosomal protein L10 [Brevinema sp.]